MKRDDLFRCRGVLFQRQSTGDSYEWHSDCGRIVCRDEVGPNQTGRMVKTYYATLNDVRMFGKYPTLFAAMSAAVEAIQDARAAA